MAPRASQGPREPAHETESGPEAFEGNKPLSFALKLEAGHPYLLERGVDAATAEAFGLGYCSRGVMKGRIAIPIHDEEGNLVAYAGRWPGEDPPEGEDKYKLPAGFKKNRVLFNLYRLKDSESLVLVEGYWSVFRLHSFGVSAAALMGSALSERHAELLLAHGTQRIVLMLDGDKAGREAAAAIAARLVTAMYVRVVELPEGQQPDRMPLEDLRTLLSDLLR